MPRKGRKKIRGSHKSFSKTFLQRQQESFVKNQREESYAVQPLDISGFTMGKAFVRNIPYSIKKKQLALFLEDKLKLLAGPLIQNQRVVGCKILLNHESNTSKGCAFVTLADSAYLEYLIGQSNKLTLLLEGRNLIVSPDRKQGSEQDFTVPDWIDLSSTTGLSSHNYFYIPSLLVGNMLNEQTALWQWSSTAFLRFNSLDNAIYVCFKLSHEHYRIKFIRSKVSLIEAVQCPNTGQYILLFNIRQPPFIDIHNRNAWPHFDLADLCRSLSLSLSPAGSERDVRNESKADFIAEEILPNMDDDRSFSRTTDPVKAQVFRRCQVMKLTVSAQNDAGKRFLNNLKTFGFLDKHTTRLPNENLRELQQEYTCSVDYKEVEENIAQYVEENVDVLLQYWLACLTSTKVDLITLFSSEFLTPAITDPNMKLFTAFVEFLTSIPKDDAIATMSYALQDHSLRFIFNPAEELSSLLSNLGDDLKDIYQSIYESNASTMFTKRICLTPLREVVRPPEPDMSNRVISDYKAWSHRFIRVSVLDEHFGALHTSSAAIFDKRVRTIFQDGFRIYGRRYSFLACSSSQLRERSCWFYDSSPNHAWDQGSLPCPSADEIRKSIGDFSRIISPWKFTARLGQGFSSSLVSLSVKDSKCELIEDIERNERCFSDGVGTITKDLAIEIASVLRLETVPSAFQIRYGGCKGVVSVLPYEGKTISVRPSMMKFSSDHQELFILSYAKPIPFYLNRQLVPILSHAGISDHAFINLLNDMLQHIFRALEDEASAKNLITIHSSCFVQDVYVPSTDFSQHDDSNPFTTSNLLSPASPCHILLQALDAGFLLKDEGVLKGALMRICKRLLLDVQTKARIYVPQAITLMGIIDLTNSLNEGEVFVQFTTQANENCLLKESVAVGRNPSLHPGDVRILQAVDRPALMHLRNVIVFSSKGVIPVQSMMSGGDLDGDLYFVVYDANLVPDPMNVPEPMDYQNLPAIGDVLPACSNTKSRSNGNEFTVEDMADCVVDYMKNDNLGMIAILHMAYADKEGIDSLSCLKLAILHSKAVDYAKTGVPAPFPDNLMRSAEFPHFMERRNRMYESSKVLGKMFNSVVRLRENDKLLGGDKHKHLQPNLDASLCLDGAEAYMADALHCLTLYNLSLWQIMTIYEVYDELELWTGFICKFSVNHSKTRGQDLQNRVRTAMNNLRKEYAEIFWEEFVFNDEFKIDELRISELSSLQLEEAKKKASAWYQVCYDAKDRDCRFYSFAWIPWQILCLLKHNDILCGDSIYSA